MSLVNKIYKKYVDRIFKTKEFYDLYNNEKQAHKISEVEITPDQRRAFQAEMLSFCKQHGYAAKITGTIPQRRKKDFIAPKVEVKNEI